MAGFVCYFALCSSPCLHEMTGFEPSAPRLQEQSRSICFIHGKTSRRGSTACLSAKWVAGGVLPDLTLSIDVLFSQGSDRQHSGRHMLSQKSDLARRSAWVRYGVAIVCVVLGWLAREAITPSVGPTALPF